VKSNLPNIFSIIRVLIAPVFFILIKAETNFSIQLGCILFLVAAFTDYLDGWWARKYAAVTSWGAFFDPLADKILTLTAFIAFVTLDILPLWMVLIIIIRDLLTTLMRIFADNRNKPIITTFSAKVKTFFQMLFIIFLLALIFIKTLIISQIGLQELDSLIYSDWVYFSMLLLTIFTVWTVFEYISQNKFLISQLLSETFQK
jgi:CDP-diacylglycerol---glycerol-3-phosphate 3-phosphatidyltransferase